MASEVMNQVNKEVERIWGPDSIVIDAIGEHRPCYNRLHIETWLHHWNLLSQEADYRFSYAEVRVDILMAVERMPQKWAVDFFELYCVLGYEFDEIAEIMDCALSTCRHYWHILRRSVLQTVLNPRINKVKFDGQGPLPCGRADGGIGPWDLPLEVLRR